MKSNTSYHKFARSYWAGLRDHTPVTIPVEELEKIIALHGEISMKELEEVYLPLTHFIDLHLQAAQQLYTTTTSYLELSAKKVPYIIGIAGSVAVGKSTTAKLLQTLLSYGETPRKVELVTTDGFLYSTETLRQKGLMSRKGFPESYDTQKLIEFIGDVKAGKDHVEAPSYSHITYDVSDEMREIRQPDILLIEGINVLQVDKTHQVFVSDFFDLSFYIDADEANIKKWYVERFLQLQQAALHQPESYFHRFTSLSRAESIVQATQTWETINAINLHENILPTRSRANVILKKGSDHTVETIYLRK
ncbi:type I pantothenate kinase [Neobacillus jeddahensis]|uniref:type I pantothenate kinase n=1 Tax=Neobacillus jeddahensis TaxID=1461580 RepID=UPI00058C0363|nr:type I pantothenate kinase [Neobacillus jeddahensis]